MVKSDIFTTTKPLKQLSSAELKLVLDVFHYSPPGNVSLESKFNTLKCLKAFNSNFPKEYSLPQFVATTRTDELGNIQFVRLKTSDNKYDMTADRLDSPCTVCKNEVLKSKGSLGDGLVCSKCSCYFHNDCAPTPLSKNQLKAMDNSPSFLLLICPMCMPVVRVFLTGTNPVPDTAVQENSSAIETKLREISSQIVRRNDEPPLFDMLESILAAATSTLIKVDTGGLMEGVEEQLQKLTEIVKETENATNNSLISIENHAEAVGTKISHLEELNVEELTKKIKLVSNAIDTPKQLKLLQKTIEIQLKSFKEESKKMIEMKDVKPPVPISDAGIEKISDAISQKVNTTERNLLQDIKSDTGTIIDVVKMLPAGIKANNAWDRLQGSQVKKHEEAPFVSVTYSPHRGKNPSAISSVDSTTGTSNRSTGSQPDRKKVLCNEEKTIAIDNIKCYDKFVKVSSLTKKEFNRHFEKVRIVHSKGTRRGTLLIELDTKETAEETVKNWKPACFSTDGGQENKTTATMMKNKNCRCIITEVDTDHTDDFIREELSSQLNLPTDSEADFTVRRFVTRENKRLFTVMVTFSEQTLLAQALEKEQVLIGRSYCPIQKYNPKPYVIQCFKCYKFDHHSAWCSKKQQTCPFCMQQHDPETCPTRESKNIENYRCVNCPKDNHHASTSKSCPAFIAKLNSVQTFNRDQ